MKIINKIILTIIISITIACDKNDSNGKNNDLTDITWILIKYFDERSGMNTINPEENEYYSIIFKNSGEISAKDACNDCSGSFDISDDNSVEISGMSCTEMVCAGLQYFSSFNGDFSFQVNNDTLELTSSGVTKIYYFVQ